MAAPTTNTLHDDEAMAEDLKALVRMASLVTGMPNAFITFADEAPPAPDGIEDKYCGVALRGTDDILVAEDVRLDARTRAIAARRPDANIVTYAAALIQTDDGRRLGTLCIADAVRRTLDDDQLMLLRGLARQAMKVLTLRQTQRELQDALATMTRLATLDDLTELLNRRAFFQEADRLYRLVMRQKGGLAIAIVDIDHFKRVNDEHGHAAGDAVLKGVAAQLRAGLRDSDLVGRIGGEEFAIAMPFVSRDDALARLDHLRERVAQSQVDGIRVTISGGMAEPGPAEARVEDALRRADAALYRAKEGGRNRVMLAEPPPAVQAEATSTASLPAAAPLPSSE